MCAKPNKICFWYLTSVYNHHQNIFEPALGCPAGVAKPNKICFCNLTPKVNHHQNIFATTRGAEHRAEGRAQRSRRPKAEAGPLPCSTSSAGLRPAKVDHLLLDEQLHNRVWSRMLNGRLRRTELTHKILACFLSDPAALGTPDKRLGAVEWLPAFGLQCWAAPSGGG